MIWLALYVAIGGAIVWLTAEHGVEHIRRVRGEPHAAMLSLVALAIMVAWPLFVVEALLDGLDGLDGDAS